jgi:hypothetical protein
MQLRSVATLVGRYRCGSADHLPYFVSAFSSLFLTASFPFKALSLQRLLLLYKPTSLLNALLFKKFLLLPDFFLLFRGRRCTRFAAGGNGGREVYGRINDGCGIADDRC